MHGDFFLADSTIRQYPACRTVCPSSRCLLWRRAPPPCPATRTCPRPLVCRRTATALLCRPSGTWWTTTRPAKPITRAANWASRSCPTWPRPATRALPTARARRRSTRAPDQRRQSSRRSPSTTPCTTCRRRRIEPTWDCPDAGPTHRAVLATRTRRRRPVRGPVCRPGRQRPGPTPIRAPAGGLHSPSIRRSPSSRADGGIRTSCPTSRPPRTGWATAAGVPSTLSPRPASRPHHQSHLNRWVFVFEANII